MDNYSEKIQDYIDGLLSDAEKQSFEDALAKDEGLRKETELQQQIQDVLSVRNNSEQGLQELKATLSEKGKEYFSSPPKTIALKPSLRRKILSRWGIGAGVAACILIGLAFFGVFSSDLNQLPILQSEVVRGATNNDNISMAINAFNHKDYKTSIRLFSEISEKDKDAVRFKYYLGLSYCGDKQYESATEILIPVADGVSLYQDKAAYYIAVAAKESGKKQLALKYVQKVSKGSPYYNKASRLIKKLQ